MDRLPAGNFDRRITIEESVEAPDSYGQANPTWNVFRKCFAEYLPMVASERFRAQGIHGFDVARFRIRFCKGLTPKMRIQFDGKIWRILGIAELTRRGEIEISAEVVQ